MTFARRRFAFSHTISLFSWPLITGSSAMGMLSKVGKLIKEYLVYFQFVAVSGTIGVSGHALLTLIFRSSDGYLEQRFTALLDAADCGDYVEVGEGRIAAVKNIDNHPEHCTTDITTTFFIAWVPTNDPYIWVSQSETTSYNRNDCDIIRDKFVARITDPAFNLNSVYPIEQLSLVEVPQDDGTFLFESRMRLSSFHPVDVDFSAQFALVWQCPEGVVTDYHRDPDGEIAWFPVSVGQ